MSPAGHRADNTAPETSAVVRRSGTSRGPAIAWLAVLVVTIAAGVLGQHPSDADTALATPATHGPTASATIARSTTRPAIARPAADRPAATRPPIGEDGLMGGLPFGSAWRWLDPERGD